MNSKRPIGSWMPLWITLIFLLRGASAAGLPNGYVRLAGSKQYNEGRVEVFYNGQWGTVCNDNWELQDADVVCRALGFQKAEKAVTDDRYGQGSGPILLDDVACQGYEPSLAQCKSRGWKSHDCSHAEDAGVVCYGERPTLPSTLTNNGDIPKASGPYELDHSSKFSEALDNLYDSKLGCDLSIVAETPEVNETSQTFCVNKVLLSLNPEAGFMLNGTEDTYTMSVEKECTPYVDSFIRYLYIKKIKIHLPSVKCIHKMASMYGVTSLQKPCAHLYRQILPGDPTFKNQLDLYNYALSSKDPVLEDLCLQYLAWNCEAFSQSAAWLNVSSELLHTLLSRSDVVVPSEIFLLNALQRWCSMWNPGEEIIRKLLGEIRFPMMPPEQLFGLKLNVSFYKDFEPFFQGRILQAMMFHTLTVSTLKQHSDLTEDMYHPRIYTSPTWSHHKPKQVDSTAAPYQSYRRYPPHNYDQFGQSRPSKQASFQTPKHHSFAFDFQMSNWTAIYLQNSASCSANSNMCISSLGLRLNSNADSSVQYDNKAVFFCQGSYVSDVLDLKNSMSIVPMNSNSSFPCPEGYAKYVYVVRPLYSWNN